jgi:hypothetical protein
MPAVVADPRETEGQPSVHTFCIFCFFLVSFQRADFPERKTLLLQKVTRPPLFWEEVFNVSTNEQG